MQVPASARDRSTFPRSYTFFSAIEAKPTLLSLPASSEWTMHDTKLPSDSSLIPRWPFQQSSLRSLFGANSITPYPRSPIFSPQVLCVSQSGISIDLQHHHQPRRSLPNPPLINGYTLATDQSIPGTPHIQFSGEIWSANAGSKARISNRHLINPTPVTFPKAFPGKSSANSNNKKDFGNTVGPKIWTAMEIPARIHKHANVKGKTVIRSEKVNANWGLNKAGKPRKRLPIACLPCREKKVKCEPIFPKCVQCVKNNRKCVFKNV